MWGGGAIFEPKTLSMYLKKKNAGQGCLRMYVFSEKPLTHISLTFFLWNIDKRRVAEVKPQNAASHLGLFCLLTKFSSKMKQK